jgi:hypothetical protein
MPQGAKRNGSGAIRSVTLFTSLMYHRRPDRKAPPDDAADRLADKIAQENKALDQIDRCRSGRFGLQRAIPPVVRPARFIGKPQKSRSA